MNINAREFARHFARYRRAAARGEKVRISAPDGVFILMRESPGVTGADLLTRMGRLPAGYGLFSAGGAERIETGSQTKTPARSPWDT
jgi:hypothetical protein